MIPFKSQETLHVNKGTFSLTFPRFARVDFKVILARVFLQRWGKYACKLCVNAFSCVKGYPSLDSNADSPSLMQEIRSNKWKLEFLELKNIVRPMGWIPYKKRWKKKVQSKSLYCNRWNNLEIRQT